MSVDSAPLRILLLGGFEVWSGGRLLRGFESQKVRALLAYLACHRGRALSRDHLAGVFWGEKDGDTARRNLRQAVYNLKATLPGEDSARPHLVVDSQELRFDEASDYWLDVEAFERAVGKGRGSELGGGRGAPAAHRDLVGAMQHYRGDLLSGFLVKECPEFEEWLVTAQESLRDSALEALRTLVDGYLERGEYRLGIEHARRLVAMDPLSEEAHRHLMKLYELGGHRARALAHYADLRELLRRELGVEPLAETRALHQSILGDALRAEGASERAEPLGPIVPMVDREAALAELTGAWQTVLEGTFQATLLVGEEGVGKTRLARSFLDAVTARRPATVLVGLCYEQQPQASCRALVEALRQALSDDPEGPNERLARLSATARSELSCLLPELGSTAEAGAARTAPPARGALGESVAELLRELTRDQGTTSGRPLILFLDDLQWADAGTLAILEELPRWLAGARVWLVATCDSSWDGSREDSDDDAASALDHPLARLQSRDGDGVVTCVELERLPPAAIEQIAGAIVDRHDVAAVAELLASASHGLPLAIVTLVNAMWDERQLVAGEDGRWSFRGSAASWAEPAKDGFDKVLLKRVRRLPTSTRRLASMAAVIGPRFDTELLQRAEDEHAKVVEVGLELLLERWLVRQYRERWNPTGLESSLALWSRGARRGRFLFDHPRVRAVLYAELNPIRRQVVHGQVAAALEKLHESDPDEAAEDLAHHALLAGQWERALSSLKRSARKATAAGDPDGAAHCWALARRAVERLLAQAGSDDERRRWRSEEETVSRALAAAPG